MLTGEKPLNVTERYSERLKAPHEINPDISMQVSSAVMLAMEMKGEDRFQNIDDFRGALKQLSSPYSRPEQAGPVSNTFVVPETKLSPLLSEELFVDAFGMEFVLVKAGSFMMGAGDKDKEAEKHEKPLHQVVLGNDFYLAKFILTQDKWERIMGNNPSHFKSSKNLPVESVSWIEVQHFIDKLNKSSNLKYRLPTEAEWEFAAKGGLKTANFIYSGSNIPEEVAWFKTNSKEMTQPVGAKKANELGLFDMSGNVWEWCNDYYDMYSNALQNNPKGPQNGTNKVLRGGGWVNNPKVLRVSDRGNLAPEKKGSIIGFRLLLEI
jgi:formylglycine-generating enzyme required for sulfatase activity